MSPKELLRGTLLRFGYQIRKKYPIDFEPDERETCEAVARFTLTSPERIVSLTRAVKHVIRRSIPGDLVECGVWQGGSMMAVARTLLQLGDTSRTLYLFDTYEGMSAPEQVDRTYRGDSAAELMAKAKNGTVTAPDNIWCVGNIDEVRKHMESTGYPADKVRFIKGRVEETIPDGAPERIALLRLDTDFYQSTRHELIHLYPRLVQHGILIIDDYGMWDGARKAVDEYFDAQETPAFLHRIDDTGRSVEKA